MHTKKGSITIFLPSTYRIPMAVTESLWIGRFDYPVCPRCHLTMDREYQHYCDRCGQCLSWKQYDK